MHDLRTLVSSGVVRRTVATQATFVMLAAAVAGAQTETGRFVSVRGTDTLTREEFTRTPSSLSGTVTRSNGAITKYEAHLLPNAAVDRLRVMIARPGDTLVTYMEQRGDSVYLRQEVDTIAVAGRDVVPTLNVCYALYEQAIRRGLAIGGTAPAVPWYRALQAHPTIANLVLTRPTPDSAVLTLDATASVRFQIDSGGRLLHGDAGANAVRVHRMK